MADRARTPDICARCIIALWGVKLTIRYCKPQLSSVTIGNLLARAGLLIGVGDWRHEKGGGNYGMFELVAPQDPRFLEVLETGGRAAQDAALTDPVCYDRETEELLNWWRGELVARERTAERSKPATKVSAGSSNRRLGSNSDRGAKTPKV
jgi:hypothetical protein